jgi:multiple sugar transport system substrate-binding protein
MYAATDKHTQLLMKGRREKVKVQVKKTFLTGPGTVGPRKSGRRAPVGASLLVIGLLAGLGPPSSLAGASTLAPAAGTSCKPGATVLTMWGWAGGYDQVVAAFNKSHPDICVEFEDNGAGNTEYTKLQSAIKAGVGVPDVAEIEYIVVPSFEITHSLLNLVPYGADAYKSSFVPFAWQEVSEGPAVYAFPADIGTMGALYDKTLLAKYNITLPTTWAQFATDAATFHKDDPGAYLANMNPSNGEFLMAMMQEWGAFPFQYTSGSTKVTIDFTGPAQMAFAKFWQGLISTGAASHTADMDTQFWNGMDSSQDAYWPAPAWAVQGLGPLMKKTFGDWSAAPLPQVTAGGHLDGTWGGSTIGVLAATKHPKQAAEFAEWFGGNKASWAFLANPAVNTAVPGYLPVLDSKAFLDRAVPNDGSQKSLDVYYKLTPNVVAPQWPPFMTEVLTEISTALAGVVNGTETIPAGFSATQSALVSYAKAQGFTVSQ